MKIYIAGPMRGYPRWNFDAFDEAELRWRAAGHTPVSPASIDRALGIDPDGPLEQIDGDFARQAMQLDLSLIFNSDAIALLPDWEGSTGCAVELALAQYLELPVYDAVGMQKIFVTGKPWSRLQTPSFSSLEF